MQDWPSIIHRGKAQAAAPVSHYSFAWRLSGDRPVAPLQVFDNGRQTWLQFAPRQAWPAVFEHAASGDRPLIYKREGPYMVLGGVWPKLVLRGGRLQSLVERLPDQTPPSPAAALHESVAAVSKPIEPASSPVAAIQLKASAQPLSKPSTAAVAPLVPLPAEKSAPSANGLASALTAASFEPAGAKGPDQPIRQPQVYAVSPADLNLRSALARWARASGWTFEPEHWAVNADIPISGSAVFGPDFKRAVQELVASTELADRPLQPCFYSNRVLRIVPYAQQCDRTAGAAEAS